MAFTFLLGAWAGPAVSQVMTIEANGEATVYKGPTVFSEDGARPVTTAPPTERGGVPLDIAGAAIAADLSPELVAAVAWRESGFRKGLVSSKGAVGEMQLMAGTAQSLNVDPNDPQENLKGGALYLRRLLTRYDGNLPLALAAYDAGPGAVDRFSGTPPFKETQAYVGSILDHLSHVALQETNGPKPGASKTRQEGER